MSLSQQGQRRQWSASSFTEFAACELGLVLGPKASKASRACERREGEAALLFRGTASKIER